VTRRREWLAIALVGLAAGGAGYGYNVWRTGSEPPSAAPDGLSALMDARLPDLDNRVRSVAQWRGNVVVVNFWATWCAPCREEIPMFVRLQSKYADRGLQFVGIAIDQPDRVRPYAAELAMNFPVLVGGVDSIELARKLGNRAGLLPFTVIVSRDGKVVATEIGAMKEAKLEPLLASLL
jgi:thiol-disulfide isomerase/thioredoxin